MGTTGMGGRRRHSLRQAILGKNLVCIKGQVVRQGIVLQGNAVFRGSFSFYLYGVIVALGEGLG